MPTQAPEIDGVTLINDFEGGEPRPGQMRRLRITEAHDYDLVGTLLPGNEPSAPIDAAHLSCKLPLPYEVPHLQEGSQTRRSRVPFCSERCRIIDLGNWASEKYVISTRRGRSRAGRRRYEPDEWQDRRRMTRLQDAGCSPCSSPPGSAAATLRKRPGTVGSAAAIGIAILIEHYAGWTALAFAALAAGRVGARHLGRRRNRAPGQHRKIRSSWWSTKSWGSGSRWPAPAR